METLYQLILILHIVTGAVALVSGGIAFTARKGKGWHTKSGLTFYYSMLLAGFSALCMCLLKFNSFLFIVGLFSLYMTFTGYRSIHRPDTKQTTTRSDKIVWTLTLVGTLLFLLITLSSGGGGMLAVLLVFSIILTGMLLLTFSCSGRRKNYPALYY